MLQQNTARDRMINYVSGFADYHLTLQWDINHRTRNITTLEKRLYYFMSRVLREMQGRDWYKHPVEFIAFGEIAYCEYHIHILLKDDVFTMEQWLVALHKVVDRAKKTPVPKAPYLQKVMPGTESFVAAYDIKQLNHERFGSIANDSIIIPSDYLFDTYGKKGKQKRERRPRPPFPFLLSRPVKN